MRRCPSDAQMPLRYADAFQKKILVEEMTNIDFLQILKFLDERGNGDQPTAAES
jgi:hypothetical protein